MSLWLFDGLTYVMLKKRSRISIIWGDLLMRQPLWIADLRDVKEEVKMAPCKDELDESDRRVEELNYVELEYKCFRPLSRSQIISIIKRRTPPNALALTRNIPCRIQNSMGSPSSLSLLTPFSSLSKAATCDRKYSIYGFRLVFS